MNMKEYFKKYTKQSKKGFTLVELIAVVVIMSIISTATVSIFLSVQTTVRDTGKLTTDQYSTTQMEKFIRNEFQTASNVDVYYWIAAGSSGEGVPADDFEPDTDDELLYYNNKSKQLVFKIYSDSSSSSNRLIIDQVEDVTIDICPLDYDADDSETDNMPYKLVYKVKTANYTYSGGIVLGNSHVSDSKAFESGYMLFGGNTASIHWSAEETPVYCIGFHSLSTQKDAATS